MKDFFYLLQNYCNENNIISEFVRFHPWLKTQDACNEFLKVDLWNQVVAVDLTKSEQEIWADFDSKNRNRIRKSQTGDVIVKQDLDFKYLGEFCQLYCQTMDRKDALNYFYFDKQFFQNMIDLLRQNITFFHAFVEDKIIASTLVLYTRNFVHAHLACANADYLNLAPYNLLFYEIILWAKKAGAKFLILGGGTSSRPDDSLFRFKKRFTKKYYVFYIGKKIHNKAIYDLLCQKKLQYEQQKNIIPINDNFFPLYRRC